MVTGEPCVAECRANELEESITTLRHETSRAFDDLHKSLGEMAAKFDGD